MQYVYSILPWVLIFGVFWFFLIRPQQKQQKAHKDMLTNLKSGDKVVTIGGIKGTVIKIKDNYIKVRVSPNVDIDMVKNSIGHLDESGDEDVEE